MSKQEIVRELFAGAIPEVADGSITIEAIAREPGFRSKVAVHSRDDDVDSVGVCVGVRGTRIKQIVDTLGGEKIDLIRWNEDSKELIRGAIQPATVKAIVLDEAQRRATLFLEKDQESLALGRRGMNLRLAGDLCGYEIVVETL